MNAFQASSSSGQAMSSTQSLKLGSHVSGSVAFIAATSLGSASPRLRTNACIASIAMYADSRLLPSPLRRSSTEICVRISVASTSRAATAAKNPLCHVTKCACDGFGPALTTRRVSLFGAGIVNSSPA